MHGQRVVVTAPNQVTLQVFDFPSPAPTQVLLKARTTLISPGTERAFYMALPNTNATYPLYPGYSFVGEVIAVGAAVNYLTVGQRVACTANHGAYATVEAAGCHPIPDGVSDEDATFFNLIAIAMQGIRKSRIELGEPVMVIGAGLIGLFAMQLARLSGALPVIAVDLDKKRLELAKQVGVDHAFISDAAVDDNLKAVTGGRGPAVTIEATGVPPVVVKAFQWTGTRGRVVLLGSTRGDTDGVNFYRDVHRKGLTVIGGHEITRPVYENNPGWWTQHDEHRVTLGFLAQGRIETQPLISHRFGWEDFPKAYDLLSSGQLDALGMVIQW